MKHGTIRTWENKIPSGFISDNHLKGVWWRGEILCGESVLIMAVVSCTNSSTYCGWCSSYFFFCLSFFLVDDGSKLYYIWNVWRPWSALCLAKPVGFYSWLQSCETLTMEKWKCHSFLHRLLSRCGPSFWMELSTRRRVFKLQG